MASFSSRGPVTIDGSNRIKPDIMAPGTSTRSAVSTLPTTRTRLLAAPRWRGRTSRAAWHCYGVRSQICVMTSPDSRTSLE